MWELSLSQASFHSLSKVKLNCRWRGWKAWHSMVQKERGWKGKGFFFFVNSWSCIFSSVASRTCDLEAKQIIKKTTNNMQVSKFSSFRVYCRKGGKTDKLKISKASSWFSILLLSLHLLFLIFFLLCLLFVLFFFSFWSLVLYREFLQLLCNFVCTISVACGKNSQMYSQLKKLWKFKCNVHGITLKLNPLSLENGLTCEESE